MCKAHETHPATALPRLDVAYNLTHGLLDLLGRAIVTSSYEARPFPTEGEIAKAYGVSRSVTREAVKMLVAKGLVSVRARLGVMIRPLKDWNLFDADVLRWFSDRQLSVDLLRQFSELRIVIEPGAAALASRFRNVDDLAAIFAALEAMAAEGGDPLSAYIEFHLTILRASQNPFYTQLQTFVATALRISDPFASPIDGHCCDLAGHALVARHIYEGNPGAARAAMEATLRGEGAHPADQHQQGM